MNGRSLQRCFVATIVVCSLAFGGCLTLDPTVTADTNGSAVFERIAPSESWSSQRVRAKATLTASPSAGNVSTITVVSASGTSFSTAAIDPGQTNVSLELPANETATLVASDAVNGTTIEKLNVTTGGDSLL
ncbi:hypothetical protein C448_00070 [Halococcus morrhuae DSM 1307]|uniref:Uncharacterized protein n=1 Tax=Halococcus morrhuae DSM 1307 TaxID=931277 RepID=M0N449_HALMO|nr:hypothetical protein [Halococcus morrhuae]EMA52323.1 hypothetical protein C448_00070 [Halococcus morrhuae DSM 1307]